MSNCYECDTILSDNSGGIMCILKRYRKYIIGFVAGVIIAYLIIRFRGQKK